MSRFMVLLTQKEIRESKRYSQREIARATNTSPAVVSRWMSGDIAGANLATVRKFCEWLDCDVGDLLTVRGDKETA